MISSRQKHARRRHASRLVRAAIATLLMAVTLGSISALPASAAGETLTVLLSQQDGTAPFDATDDAGYDTGDSNAIVRTNDNMTYTVEVGVADADAEGVTVTIPLPQGQEAGELPPYCGAGSGVSPAMTDPVSPLTATSWLALPAQTITCVIGHRDLGSTEKYQFVGKVRPEVPNGTVFAPVTASATSTDLAAPSVSAPSAPVTVSARAKLDMSKNALAGQENTGWTNFNTQLCSDGSGRQCQIFTMPISISVPDPSGRGNSPTVGDITLTDDLSPDSLYGSGITSSAGWAAAGAGALAKYGATMVGCGGQAGRTLPGSALASTEQTGVPGTTDNSVRDSGGMTCSQPGGPGTPVTITITNPDTTAYTYPTEAKYPVGTALPAGQAVVVSRAVVFEIPNDAVFDLGAHPSPNSWSLPFDNKFTDLQATGLDGTATDPAANATWNDHRGVTATIENNPGFEKQFVGVPGAVGNTPPEQYNPGYPFAEGPTGTTTWKSGDGIMLAGQQVISTLMFSDRGVPGMPTQNMVGCDLWDNTKLALAKGNYGAVPTTSPAIGQRIASGGAAVWVSGVNHGNNDGTYTGPFTVEYGDGASGDGTTCGNADSPSGWVTDPASLPGNDPALAATGVYTAVTKVRVFVQMTPYTDTNIYDLFVSIGLQALPNPVGTVLPNYSAAKFLTADEATEADVLADPNDWYVSHYDEDAASGSLGDRMLMGSVMARLKKEVKNPLGNFVTTTPNFTAGNTVSYRLSPTLTAGTTTDYQVPVTVEDCLPADESFVVGSSNPAPEVVDLTAPADAEISCGTGETYVRWNLGPQQINATLPQITYDVTVSKTATDGIKENHALVIAEGDPSTAAQRSAKADIQLTSPAGIKIDKKALKPLIEVNRTGETNPASLDWRVTFANIQVPTGVRDVDVIDVLPADGNVGSSFSGDVAFKDATVSSGTGVTIQYTSAANPNIDPADTTNGAAGSTTWCDAPSGGSVVSGSGSCPGSADEVTGLRFLRPGAFTPADTFSVDVSVTPSGNAAGDVYVNRAEGRATGLQLPVGPVSAPETVIASAVGDYVWDDANMNGVQDAGEAPIEGFKVTLTGTDTDGNDVGPLTTVTDAAGKYVFSGLQSGDYEVTFDPASLTAEQHFTMQDQGSDDAVDSDGDPATGVAKVTLAANAIDISVDQGVFTADPKVEITKFINGDDANTAPGVLVQPGQDMLVTFEVHNNGNMALDPVVITDDTIDSAQISCPKTALAIDETMTCSAAYPAPAAGKQHTNVATVTGTPVPLPDGTKLPDVTDDDPANATGATHGVGITKKVVGTPVANGDGTYTVSYDVVVTNTGTQAETYDLDDQLHFGEGTHVTGAAVTSSPTGVALNPAWNGGSDTRVATGASIPVDGTDTYRVEATASIDVATATTAASDCELATGESGTGFLNGATLTANGTTTAVDDCAPFPVTTMTKTLVGAPVLNDDGTYTVSYDLDVTNDGAAADVYDLTDQLHFGAGIDVLSAAVENTAPGSIATNSGWDGLTDTTVVEDQAIGAGGHDTYRVKVDATVTGAITVTESDCTLDVGESGTGFLNVATISVNGVDSTKDACAETPPVEHTSDHIGIIKTAKDASITDDGVATVTYDLTVTNTGDGAGTYDLDDQLLWSGDITITSAQVTATPDGLTANSAWDGQANTAIANQVDLEAGGTHVWTVEVTGQVPTPIAKASGDCELGEGEQGSGMLNAATVNTEAGSAGAEACVSVETKTTNTTTTSTTTTTAAPSPGTSTGNLPRTGTDVGLTVLVGLALVGGGAFVLRFRRMRAIR